MRAFAASNEGGKAKKSIKQKHGGKTDAKKIGLRWIWRIIHQNKKIWHAGLIAIDDTIEENLIAPNVIPHHLHAFHEDELNWFDLWDFVDGNYGYADVSVRLIRVEPGQLRSAVLEIRIVEGKYCGILE